MSIDLQKMAFRFLGGKCNKICTPALVQTETFFHYGKNTACVTAKLTTNNDTIERMKMVNASEYAEASWISVLESLRFSLEKGFTCINIEHNDSHVVKSLLYPTKRRQKLFVPHYKYKILTLADSSEQTAIRWNPNTHNENDYLTDLSIQHVLKE